MSAAVCIEHGPQKMGILVMTLVPLGCYTVSVTRQQSRSSHRGGRTMTV